MAGELKEGSAEWFAARTEARVRGEDPDAAAPVEVAAPPEPEALEAVEEVVDEVVGSAEEAADAAEEELGTDASQEEIDQARQAAADEFYAGRYRTREDVEKALKEQVSLIGRQGQENGELKKRNEELEAAAAEAEVADTQPQQIDRAAWNEWAEQAVEEGAGAEGALAALKDGGYAGYEVYLGKWLVAEDDDQRAAAILFNNAMMIRLNEQQRAEQQAQPVVEEDPGSEVLAARQIAMSKRPDFDEMKPYMDRALENMDEGERAWLSTLAESGVEGKVRAMDQIYLEAKLLSGDAQTRAQVEADRQTAASSDRAKLAASDTPSVASKVRTPLPAAEQVAIEYGDARRKIWGTPLRGEQG